MENFRTGDFIRLKDIDLYKMERFFCRDVNIFEISNIEDEYVKVKCCQEKIPISEIEAIPINGIADLDIYYDPVVAGSTILPNEPLSVHRIDKCYYYEKFSRCYDSNKKNFQELIKENGIQHVHEVQHFLFDHFHMDIGLKINAY